jgi:ATP-dependent RNA helicase DDX31/DBP7
MADGMILNFAVDPTTGPTAQKFKGGFWKDRVRAKKAARYNAQHRSDPDRPRRPVDGTPRTGPNAQDFPDPRPAKRRRENGSEPDHVAQNLSSKPPTRDRTQINSDGFVSSLFTSNPAPRAVEDEPSTKDKQPSQPTNAPLIDGIDTFTSLGLSPTIAAHLLTKMDLKSPTAIQKAAVTQMLTEEGDAFIQSETGSGKTLAYLLPIVQKVMAVATEQKAGQGALHRDSGLFAIIMAPTRELCKQISVVLERLLGCANYLVAGTVTGGERKKSEKARLRKGLNILVATPGRLVDHLDNTQVLDVGLVRWLVLDEGDRLMDLGFEQDITKIITTLDQKRRKSSRLGLPDKRTTVLCSATLKMNVQKLGEISLKDASLIKGEDAAAEEGNPDNDGAPLPSAFLAPAQLKQSYAVVPSKLRLVTLTALLKRSFARQGSVKKAIVFVSCADSVDFHFDVFTRTKSPEPPSLEADTAEAQYTPEIQPSTDLTTNNSSALTLYKLHGSLPQPVRSAIVRRFHASTTPSLLIATDVASRGLDLPNLDLVIEYDPAFSADDHLHRIGRTARLGRDGRALIFLLPGPEEGYVSVLRSSYKPGTGSTVTAMNADDILRKGFAPAVDASQREWENRATQWQLDVERWVLADKEMLDKARKAFLSQIRAYATHIAAERKWFDIKELHLGHMAKAFGLRDPPAKVNVRGMRDAKGAVGKPGKNVAGARDGAKRRRPVDAPGKVADVESEGTRPADVEDVGDEDEAARKMREVVRKQRKMMLGAGGADEFNLA